MTFAMVVSEPPNPIAGEVDLSVPLVLIPAISVKIVFEVDNEPLPETSLGVLSMTELLINTLLEDPEVLILPRSKPSIIELYTINF